jgi:NAD(P)-dependent dehydrogenase (short-subunit alcohol dehydrogenase family)
MTRTPRTALVTGGASGMGREAVGRLHAAGTKVAVFDRDAAALARVEQELPGVRTWTCDVTDEAQVIERVRTVEEEVGPIDRLLHAAGIMPAGRVLDTPTEQLLNVTRVNYFGTVHVTKAVLPRMLQRGSGDVVLFGSVTGYVFSTRFGAYCASKAAVNAYAEVLLHEHADSPLRMLLVCPAAVKTPLLDQAMDEGPKMYKAVIERRTATPAQMIDAIEKALDKGQRVLVPGDAKVQYLARRLSPALLWKTVVKLNGS